jgi:hypothetical protein
MYNPHTKNRDKRDNEGNRFWIKRKAMTMNIKDNFNIYIYKK